MIPFDMARFDGLREVAAETIERRRPVVERIIETAKVTTVTCPKYIQFKPILGIKISFHLVLRNFGSRILSYSCRRPAERNIL